MNIKIKFVVLSVLLIAFFSTSCNAFKKNNESTYDYKELKQVVLDILQTDDGKKSVQEAVSEPQIKKQMVLDNEEIKKIIEEELFSTENTDALKSLYEDPKFAAKLAESLKKENEKLLKDLMKDPEYRQMLIETMNDEEFEKIILDIMKSNTYRTQMMLVIKDTFENPMFKDDLLKLMEEASKEALKVGDDKKNDEEKQEEEKGE